MLDLTSPSCEFDGNMLSTNRLYRGLNAVQQPQQPNILLIKYFEIIEQKY